METNADLNTVEGFEIRQNCDIYQNDKRLYRNILYSKQSAKNDVISDCFCYNTKKHRIENHPIKFSTVENRKSFDNLVKQLGTQRRQKNKVFAFVNPASGTGKGVDVFHKIVKKHLVGAGIEVESQVTEKEGENSLEEIAKRLDLDSYDAVVVLGGDSSLRDIVNGLWEKAGKPDPKEALKLPTFTMIAVGSGNGAASKWNGGTASIDSGVAAFLLGNSTRVQMARMTSLDGSLDKLGVCCFAYGWSIDAFNWLKTTNLRGPSRYAVGGLHAMYNHTEPYKIQLELTLTDKEEKVQMETRLRDLMLTFNDFSVGNSRLKSEYGTLVLTDGNISKGQMVLASLKLVSKIVRAHEKPIPFGSNKEGNFHWFVGNVKKVVVQIPEDGNERSVKNMVNLDGDIYECAPCVQIEFLEESISVFYIDTE